MVVSLTRVLALLVAIAATLIAPPSVADAQRSTAPPDFALPNGHFYSQAAPGQNWAGYRVANEAGVPL